MSLYNDDVCVMCGTYIPEGQMVCAICKRIDMNTHSNSIDFLSTRKLDNRENGGDCDAKL